MLLLAPGAFAADAEQERRPQPCKYGRPVCSKQWLQCRNARHPAHQLHALGTLRARLQLPGKQLQVRVCQTTCLATCTQMPCTSSLSYRWLEDAVTDWQTSQGQRMHMGGLAGYTPKQARVTMGCEGGEPAALPYSAQLSSAARMMALPAHCFLRWRRSSWCCACSLSLLPRCCTGEGKRAASRQRPGLAGCAALCLPEGWAVRRRVQQRQCSACTHVHAHAACLASRAGCCCLRHRTIYTQMGTLFVQQGNLMDRSMALPWGHQHMNVSVYNCPWAEPPASLQLAHAFVPELA